MYTSFDLSRQAEEMAYEWVEYVEVLEEIARQTRIREMQANKRNLRDGIADLCKYGMTVGFTSIEFYSACEEAFVNADRQIALLLEEKGVETVDEFVMFVRGCGFVMEG